MSSESLSAHIELSATACEAAELTSQADIEGKGCALAVGSNPIVSVLPLTLETAWAHLVSVLIKYVMYVCVYVILVHVHI